MKKILATITGICISLAAMAASDYATTAAKAQRFFDAHEWASAQALYGLMLDQKPDADSVYIHAIVASSMLGHNKSASNFLTDAMKAGVSFSRLMEGVKSVSFEVGAPAVYEEFLKRSQHDCPWLKRAIDAELLNYYIFRNNGQLTVEYAHKMLAGLPESIKYLSDLADGYLYMGDGDLAAYTWKHILTLDPDNYLTLLKLGNYSDMVGNRTEAAEYLHRAAKIRLTPFVAKRLAALDTVEKKH